MPVWLGSTTASTAAAATAASIALPPRRRTSTAVEVASGFGVAAMPSVAWTGDRPGSWKSRMERTSKGAGTHGAMEGLAGVTIGELHRGRQVAVIVAVPGAIGF